MGQSFQVVKGSALSLAQDSRAPGASVVVGSLWVSHCTFQPQQDSVQFAAGRACFWKGLFAFLYLNPCLHAQVITDT